MQIATFTDRLDIDYKYMPLPEGGADVFIYQFVGEQETEDGTINYIYNFNEFRTTKLTEEEIAADPLSFMEYFERELTQEEKIEALEKEVAELKEKVEQLEQ